MEKRFETQPATRWDRLVAALAEVEPERSIDASHILERAKKEKMSDLDIYYTLALRYQEKSPLVLIKLMSLYALSSACVEWLQKVRTCFDIKKGKVDAAPRAFSASPRCGLGNSVTSDLEGTLTSQDSSGGFSPMSRNTTSYPSETTGDAGNHTGPGGTSCQGRSASRAHRFRSSRASHASMNRCNFDLGAGWTWDGTLDFLRDGKVMCTLVEEALEHCNKFSALQAQHREHPESLTASAYNLLYPSLADMDRSKTRDARTTRSESLSDAFDPIASHIKISNLKQSTIGKRPSHALKVMEEQRRTMEQAEEWSHKLNDMCEHFLGWKGKMSPAGVPQPFFVVKGSDRLLHPLNEDDYHLLNRFNWLAIALFRTVKDPSIIPTPPRLSYIFCKESPERDSVAQEEDDEIAVQIATTCSCLPMSAKTSITLEKGSLVRVSHPNTQAQPLLWPCILVHGETFVFVRDSGSVGPLWWVLQYLLKKYDNISWFYEMSPLERRRETALMGGSSMTDSRHTTNTSDLRSSASVKSHMPNKEVATFDLTVQSSTVRRNRPAPLKNDSLSGSSPMKLQPPLPANPLRSGVPSGSFHVVPENLSMSQLDHESAPSVAFSTVRRVRRMPPADEVHLDSSVSSPFLRPGTSEGDDSKEAALSPSPVAAVEGSLPANGRIGLGDEHAATEDAAEEEGPIGVVPSCTISCSPSSQVMVTREWPNPNDASSFAFEAQSEWATANNRNAAFFSECNRVTNFTASVLHESLGEGISLLSHHFRVSGGPIGQGAFGAVYKALNLDTGRIVAVKQSRFTYDDDATNLNWREFETWSMLPTHPNVIAFYGASKEFETHQLLLVMEYASGGSIIQLYNAFRPIPEPLFYDHACGMAIGLKHLHSHNVIHGDVKPENVLTRSDGSVALTDFGCSRLSLLPTSSDTSSLGSAKKESGSWQLAGTAAFMAPEVILNEPHIKSDVWAYACTMMQLWLGTAPWAGGERSFAPHDSIPLMFYIANEEVTPYTEEEIGRAPRWLQRIARRAFEREVEQRCDMTEVMSILTEHRRAYGGDH